MRCQCRLLGCFCALPPLLLGSHWDSEQMFFAAVSLDGVRYLILAFVQFDGEPLAEPGCPDVPVTVAVTCAVRSPIWSGNLFDIVWPYWWCCLGATCCSIGRVGLLFCIPTHKQLGKKFEHCNFYICKRRLSEVSHGRTPMFLAPHFAAPTRTLD